MSDQIAVLSSGVWEIRDLVQKLTGLQPVRWMPPLKQPEFGCVVGWGLKPTSNKARKLAQKTDKSYIAMEDGFIRSIHPGTKEIPVSLVVDHKGVYYDATDASDLENFIIKQAQCFDPDMIKRARKGMALIQDNYISKYNHAPFLSPEEMGLDDRKNRKRILVVDQTYGDSSVHYGLANATSFQQMLEAAICENPDAEIIVKIHPEVISGRKKGYLTNLQQKNLTVVGSDVNPWSLINIVDRVYVVTSQFGFEAALAGKDVVCFGASFYAGWGVTDDRIMIGRRHVARPSLEQLFTAVYLNYARYLDPVTKSEVSFEDAVSWIIQHRVK